MKLTESMLRNIIKEELTTIVKESWADEQAAAANYRYSISDKKHMKDRENPGDIDLSRHKKDVGDFMQSKRRANSAKGKRLSDLLSTVERDIQAIKNNPPEDKSEWSKLRQEIMNNLMRIDFSIYA